VVDRLKSFWSIGSRRTSRLFDSAHNRAVPPVGSDPRHEPRRALADFPYASRGGLAAEDQAAGDDLGVVVASVFSAGLPLARPGAAAVNAPVADAWARLFDQQGPVGELEVTVQETLARWRSGAIELPDYYLVLDADSIDPTHRHWYLGFLHRAAPVRVVPVAATAAAVTDTVGHLASGRWWPDLDRLLHGVERVVPDVV